MRTRVIGDVHGKGRQYREIVSSFDGPTIQIGDLGVGFECVIEGVHEKLALNRDAPTEFFRGNHDFPDGCKLVPGYIPDGTIRNETMIIGGAWSIDGEYRRLRGFHWWEDEECTHEQLSKFIEINDVVRPKVMLTHDCPTFVGKKLFIDRGLGLSGAPSIKTLTGEALQCMFDRHQPEVHIFGHWHTDVEEVINGTTFICLGELSYIDIDLDNPSDRSEIFRYMI